MVLNHKESQTIIAVLTDDKVTELFCIADDFCKFFDALIKKYMPTSDKKRRYHRDSTMSKVEIARWSIPGTGALTISLSTYWGLSQLIACFPQSRVSMYNELWTQKFCKPNKCL